MSADEHPLLTVFQPDRNQLQFQRLHDGISFSPL